MEPGLGIDFGGVIAEVAQEDDAGSGKDGFQSAPAVACAFQGIRVMDREFRGRVWVISKAGEGTENITRQWLRAHKFEAETGLGTERVLFVRDRAGKLERCRALQISHFVDDQVKNLELLLGPVDHLFLFGARSAPAPMVAALDWPELQRLIRESLVGG